MSVALVGIGSGVILLVLLMLGLPVAFAMALVGAGGLVLAGGIDPAMGLLANLPYSTVASFSLIVIPMFILMGELVGSAGLAQKAYLAARQWFGRLPGGLAMAAIGASAFFAAVSGSSVAATATMGRLSIEEMRRHGYDGGLATGTVVVAGTLAALIPPRAPWRCSTRWSPTSRSAACSLPGSAPALSAPSCSWGWPGWWRAATRASAALPTSIFPGGRNSRHSRGSVPSWC